MSWKKTDEELIELAKQASGDELEALTQFELFMRDVGAGPGEDWVESQNIYWRYLDWCIEKDVVPKSRFRFSHGINKLYKRVIDKGAIYYVMNGEPFKLNNNDHWGMRRDWRREKEYRPWRRRSLKAGQAAGKVHRRNARLRRKLLKEGQKRKPD